MVIFSPLSFVIRRRHPASIEGALRNVTTREAGSGGRAKDAKTYIPSAAAQAARSRCAMPRTTWDPLTAAPGAVRSAGDAAMQAPSGSASGG
jgi:hypothetical protein